MKVEKLFYGRVTLIESDCVSALRGMKPRQFHAGVTDPPYEIGYGGAGWDKTGVAFDPKTWGAVLWTLHPGAHLLAFSHSRTEHRMTCGIEDSGFQIRDKLMWLYDSGAMPKGADASKSLDAELGAEREVVGTKMVSRRAFGRANEKGYKKVNVTKASVHSKTWDDWHTGLVPGFEPVVLGRAPFKGTLGNNLFYAGTGAMNSAKTRDADLRRPKNVIYTGDIPALQGRRFQRFDFDPKGSDKLNLDATLNAGLRFLTHKKANAEDRRGVVEHLTVKPINVMRWLIRLVARRGQHILDPFAGGGSTGEAAVREGMYVTLIEMDPAHCEMIRRRFAALEKLHKAGLLNIPGLKGGSNGRQRRNSASTRGRPAASKKRVGRTNRGTAKPNRAARKRKGRTDRK